jgi:hypothetical protein
MSVAQESGGERLRLFGQIDSGKSVLLQRLGDWWSRGVHWVSHTVLVATVTTLH